MSEALESFDGNLMDGLEFCAAVYSFFESLASQADGVKRIRLRTGLTEKRLVDELLPICRYVQTYYRLGRYISVRWVNGGQSYDAELVQSGAYVEQGYFPEIAYLEATCAMHENEHWIQKLLNEGQPAYAPEGITKPRRRPVRSEPVVFTNDEHVLSFAPIVTSLIQKKNAIAYPENTSLVVQCNLNSLYTPSDWRLLVETVEQQVQSSPFREVFLFDGMTEQANQLALSRT